MKVKELIEVLQQLPQDAIVILQKDSEGNGYSPLSGAEPCHYVAETTWSGEVRDHEDMKHECELEGEECPAPNAVVLWPVN